MILQVIFFLILASKFANPKSNVKYTREEFASGEKEYQFSNNTNQNEYNGSS